MTPILALGLLLAPPAAPPTPAPPTFARDVAPLVYKHCAGCHHAGDVGPFPLMSYDDARKRSGQLAEVTAARSMPPWLPAKGHGEFKHDRALTDAQIGVFQKWHDAGAPEGDPGDAPLKPQFKAGWQLGKPDIVLTMPKPFAVPAEGRDIYHHFVFDLKLSKTKYLRGIEVVPGNRKVVHHAVGILDTGGGARRLAAKVAKEFGGMNYPGNAPGFLPAGFTPGYAPGQRPAFFDAGESIPLKVGTDLVLQMHYSPSGKDETDSTQVGLYLTDAPPKRNMGIVMLGSLDIDIAPGDGSYTRRDRFELPVDYEFKSVWSHLHLIGKSVRVWADLPDQSTRQLLRIDDWDFNWQDTYVYAKPFVLPKGTVIRAEFTWDNSDANPRNPARPPVRVLNGEQSADEMGGVILGGRPARAADETAAWVAVIAHYLEVEWKKKR